MVTGGPLGTASRGLCPGDPSRIERPLHFSFPRTLQLRTQYFKPPPLVGGHFLRGDLGAISGAIHERSRSTSSDPGRVRGVYMWEYKSMCDPARPLTRL